jgi:Dynamin family
MNSISQQVVSARKQFAPKLNGIVEQSQRCSVALAQVSDALSQLDGIAGSLHEPISHCVKRLKTVAERAQMRFKRYDAGLVSIAIGGIEKSGKTTLLKTLTGIECLPTANERCTAVCCEIIYDGSRNEFDLEFHTDVEFCQSVIHPLMQQFNQFLISTQASESIQSLPANLDEFERIPLTSTGKVFPGTKPELILRELTELQRNILEIRRFVGNSPMQNQPLDGLRQWVAKPEDPVAKAKIATVARCIIRTKFEGGSENLRWIDTPGVDDPSPLARERTLRSIGFDADLLVVATMPRDTPSVTDSFVDFWTSISNLPDEIKLIDRLLILLNWKRDVDPNQIEILKHKKDLQDKNEVPPHLFCGPLEAIKREDVARFMDDVNRHLSANLATQDSLVVERLENDLKSALADVRTSVFDKARRLSPSDPSKTDSETALFMGWFNRTAKSGLEEGFLPQLRELFVGAVDTVPKSKAVSEAQADLDSLFKTHAQDIKGSLPSEAEMRTMRQKNAGAPPITAYMQHFAMSCFSDLVNALAKQVQDFGPIMQQAILDVLKTAGIRPIIIDAPASESVKSLCARLDENRWNRENDNAVLKALEELSNLQQSLHYVYRWEMRAAINFLSPLHWNQGRAVEDMALMLEQAGMTDRSKELRGYFKITRIPGVEESDQQHAEVFGHISRFALIGILAVLSGGRCRLANIADDFVRDFQTRLTFGTATETSWRELLAPQRGDLLGSKIAAIRANSEKLQKFRNAVEALGSCLP